MTILGVATEDRARTVAIERGLRYGKAPGVPEVGEGFWVVGTREELAAVGVPRERAFRGTWKTKDGRVLEVRMMAYQHLVNAIRYVERAYARWQVVAPLAIPTPKMMGEFAQLAAEQEWLDLVESPIERVFPSYVELVEEKKRRDEATARELGTEREPG